MCQKTSWAAQETAAEPKASEQLREGIIERAVGLKGHSERTYYLPHHPVVRQDKVTTKITVVFDASCAEGDRPSLNQCLHIGPSFGQSILEILIRFRTYEVALIGDVEKAFLMIRVAEKDRDALRFLWFDNPYLVTPQIVPYRFTRVVFGVASSPYLLNATIKHHIERY